MADMDCYAKFRFTGSVARKLVTRTLTNYEDTVVESIRNYAFQYCYSLATVNVPAVTNIGNYAFYYCQALTTANFPAATSINIDAFQYCRALTTVNFPAVTRIGSGAFSGCSALTTADFPAVTRIDTQAFSSCSALKTLILRNTTTIATLGGTNAFNSTPIKSGTGYIYVPRDLVDSYKAATNWSTYANQFRAIEDYPDICGGGN
jgi:hypothetical protein